MISFKQPEWRKASAENQG